MEDLIKVTVVKDVIFSEDTSTPDPEDSWDRASTRKKWKFGGLRRTRTGESPTWEGYDVFEIPKSWTGKNVFVVWLVYSTGDSFGHDENAYAEGLGVYTTYEEAEEVRQLILDDYAKGYDYGSVSSGKSGNQVTLPSGQVLYTGSWKGYFESLTDVYIDEATVPSYVGD